MKFPVWLSLPYFHIVPTYCHVLYKLNDDGGGGGGDTECTGNVGDEFITSRNIRSFEGCTVIQGNIRILQPTLTGYIVLRF